MNDLLESLRLIASTTTDAGAREEAQEAIAAHDFKYDDVLHPFLTLMKRELHANSRKGDRPGWLRMDANTALLEVYWHAAKLSAAVKNNDGPAIQEHSADVANMAMMVLDVCGGLAWVDSSADGSGVVVPVASPDLREAAKQFYNRTLADPEVIIRPPNAVKQEAITKAGQCLRIALTAGVKGPEHG